MDDFKSIILRNAGNDYSYLYMRDAVIQRAMAEYTDLDWQAWRPAMICINGEYRGILNIRERSNEDNIYTNYDGLEDIDMVENWWRIKEGDMRNYNAFKSFWNEQGHSLEEYAQWMDWQEYINLMLMNLFQNNRDFPGNNFMMWRPKTDDGRWRFLAKDIDFGLGLNSSKAEFNTIEWLFDPDYDSYFNWANKYEHTLLFRRLMEDEDFKREFIDRAAIYMGDFMNEKGIREIWDSMYGQISAEYPYHKELNIQRWQNYTNELNKAYDWLANRANHFYNHLSSYYDLGEAIPVAINKNVNSEDLKDIEIRINHVKLSKGVFDGKFFSDRPMCITAIPTNDKRVVGWSTTIVSDDDSISTDICYGDELTLTIPSCSNIIIDAQFDTEDGIHCLKQTATRWIFENSKLTFYDLGKDTLVRIYDLAGRLVFTGQGRDSILARPIPIKGFHIVRAGNHTFKLK